MEENNIYAFADQRTLNYAIESIRKTMARELALAGQAQYPAGQIFAKVGTIRDDTSGKQASASQVVWNYTTREFQAKSTGQWIWDSTADQDDIFTTTDIFCDKAMVANEVVEVRPLSGVTGDTDQWFATKSASSVTGGQNFKIEIDSGSGASYQVTVHTGFPTNDVDANNYEGTLTLLNTIESDLPVGAELMATCFELNTDPKTYDCYIFETVYTLI